MRRSTRLSSPGCRREVIRRRKYAVRSNGGRWLAASEPQFPGIRSVTSVIVDRRPDKGKSTANRQRVLKRLSGALKWQVDQLIANATPAELESTWGKGIQLVERNLRKVLEAEDVQRQTRPDHQLEPRTFGTHAAPAMTGTSAQRNQVTRFGVASPLRMARI